MTRAEFRDALCRLQRIDPLEIWPDQTKDAERRIIFRANPFQTFITSDDASQERIVAAMYGRNT